MIRILRHGVVLLAFALAAGPVVVPTAAQAADTCDGDAPCIVVTVDAPGQSPTTTTIGASSFGPGFGGYTLYGKQAFSTAAKDGKPPAGAPSGLYPSSLTAAQVVAMAGVTLTSTTIMTIPRFDGSVSALDEQDLEGTSYGNAGPPRFGINGTQLQYVRPQLANHPQDANGYDLDSVDGGELDVTVAEQGTTLHPVVQPPSSVQPGKPAQFHVVGISPDPDYSYAWQFGGGSGGGGPAPEHTYGCGDYGVQVDVSDPTTNVYGTSDVVLVDVCSKSTPSGTGAGHGTGSSSNPPTGPDEGSGHGGDLPTTAPHSRATDGQQTAPRTDPVATPTASPPTTAAPTGSETEQGSAGPTSAAVGGQQSSTTSALASGAPGGGPLLHGVVINAAQVPLSRRAAQRAAERADPPQASRRPGTTPFDATILWWLLVPVLLAVGATTERRRPRRRAARR